MSVAFVGVLAVVVLAVAGCGGDGGGQAEDGAVSITVSETAGVPSAFVDFGIDQGFFQDEGLDVQLEATQGGAATIPGLVSGDVQVGGSNVVSLLLAQEQGLPLRAIAPGTSAHEETPDFAALIVQKDSGITGPQDLEGQTVAVNTLDNIAELVVKEALDQQGVDVSQLKLSEVPFPEMGPALEAGDVDAAFQIEPFLTQNVEQGAEAIDYSYVVTRPGLQVGGYAVTEQYAQENPDVVESYQQAVAKTASYIEDNEDEFRRFLSERAGIAPELTRQMTLPVFTQELDVESLELTASLMEKHGISKQAPEVSELVEEGG